MLSYFVTNFFISFEDPKKNNAFGNYFAADLLHKTAAAITVREPFGLQFNLATGQVQMVSPPVASGLDGTSFIFLQMPRPQLVIVGAVHISQHLAPLATQIGFSVSIIDPRGIFSTPDRFPGIALHNCWPDEILSKMDTNQSGTLSLNPLSCICDRPVSYTHLTLPTNREV